MKGRPSIPVQIGAVFGRLSVLAKAEGYVGKGLHYKCKCECGREKDVPAYSLRAGKTKSCGCMSRNRWLTHGFSYKSEYCAWKGARARCGNPKAVGYKNYGGRGISICSEWANSFERFLSDMGEKPSASHSLDRIDPDGNYEPSNCRWATPETQARNKRPFKSKTGVRGVHPMPGESKFKANITVGDRTVHIGVFNSIEDAETARKAAELDLWGGECDERA